MTFLIPKIYKGKSECSRGYDAMISASVHDFRQYTPYIDFGIFKYTPLNV